MTLHGGMFTYGFSAFFVPLAMALGTSRGVLSVAFSFTRLESSLLGPIEGFFIDRFGPRGIMYVGFALFGVSLIMFSRVNSLLGFYLIFPVMTLGASMAGFLPVVTTLTNWFSRRRGLAIGVSSAGVNVGGILVAVVAMAIGYFGWRTAALQMGIITLVLGLPVAAMMRHRPQQYGYLPDGDQPVAAGTSTEGGETSPDREDGVVASFTPLQALRTSAFWFLAAAHGVSLVIVSSISIHQIPLLVDVGVPFETAASILALMTAFAMIGRIGGGYIGDKMGMKPILLVCFMSMSIGILVLATAQSVAQAFIYAFFYGMGYGARAPLFTALRGEYFGPRDFATIMGMSQPVMMLGSFFGPVIAGFAYDVQGSYRMVFTIFAVVNMVGALLLFFIKKPAPPQPRKPTPTTET